MNKMFILAGLIFLIGCGQTEEPSQQSQAMPAAQAPVSVVGENRETASDRLIEEGKEDLESGEILSAIQNFDEAIRRDPRDPGNYMVLGETYLHLKNYDKAIDTFSAVLMFEPENGPAHYMLALAYNFRGDKDQAIQHAQKSTQIFQDAEDLDNFRKSLVLLQGLTQAQ